VIYSNFTYHFKPYISQNYKLNLFVSSHSNLIDFINSTRWIIANLIRIRKIDGNIGHLSILHLPPLSMLTIKNIQLNEILKMKKYQMKIFYIFNFK
jgi:hypothetical protein